MVKRTESCIFFYLIRLCRHWELTNVVAMLPKPSRKHRKQKYTSFVTSHFTIAQCQQIPVEDHNHCPVIPGNLFKKGLFCSFGLSTKEPYTIMLCPSYVVMCRCPVFSPAYSPPSHMARHRNFIFGKYAHMLLVYAHQIVRDSDGKFLNVSYQCIESLRHICSYSLLISIYNTPVTPYIVYFLNYFCFLQF